MNLGISTAIIGSSLLHSDPVPGLLSAYIARVEADGGIVEAEDCLEENITLLNSLGLWSKASAVWLPHGYKEDKLYAVKGGAAADLTFARAGTRTRKGPSYIEGVPYNLSLNSEQFNLWTPQGTTITADAAVAPDGSTTADKLIENSSSSLHYVTRSTDNYPGGTHTFSCYVKADTRTWAYLASFDGVDRGAYFNLSNGTIGAVDAGASASIQDVGNGWYRCIVTATPTLVWDVSIQLATGSGVRNYLGDGTSGLFIWGMQVVQGASAMDYFHTTNRQDVPALDYTNSICPSLSLEPARTNLLLRSEEFDNVYYTKTRTTVTANSILSPENLTTADKLVETVDAGTHLLIAGSISATTTTTYTQSIFLKAGERSKGTIQFVTAAIFGGTNPIATFDLLAGTSVMTNGTGSTTITDFGDGWFRVSITATTTGAGSTGLAIAILDNSGTTSYTGDGTSGFYIWGGQFEAGSYATSYIPTTVATVSRIADSVPSLTGVSSLIGQTEGTMYLHLYLFADGNQKAITLHDGVTANVRLRTDSSNNLICDGGTISIPSVAHTTGIYKVAIVYSASRVAFFVNGTLIGADTTVTITPSDRFGFENFNGSADFYGEVLAAALCPVTITDAEAIALTTL